MFTQKKVFRLSRISIFLLHSDALESTACPGKHAFFSRSFFSPSKAGMHEEEAGFHHSLDPDASLSTPTLTSYQASLSGIYTHPLSACIPTGPDRHSPQEMIKTQQI